MNDLSKYGSWEKLDEFTDSSSDISSEEVNTDPSTPPTIRKLMEQDDFLEEGEVKEDEGYGTPSTTRGLAGPHEEVKPQPRWPDVVKNDMNAEKRQDYMDNMFYTKAEFEYHYMDGGSHWEFQDPRNILRRQYIHDIIYYNPHLSKRRLDILIDKMIAYAC